MNNKKSGDANKYFKFAKQVFLFTAVILFFPNFVRIFICDQFVVPSDSMEPTMIAGDRILVNKMVFGARIYKDFDFSDKASLSSFRMPGTRGVHVNDVVVFNAPYGYSKKRITFQINYVYSKRCIGTPGDSISIKNGFFVNNRFPGIIGNEEQQQRLSETPDSLIYPKVLRAMPFNDQLFGWTIKNFGPLYIPQAGEKIKIDLCSYKLYRRVIEYETGLSMKQKETCVFLNGVPLDEYTFKKNYYFFCGDNVSNSKDSRYLGFVPEEFIIGVAQRISYSKNPQSGKKRLNRIWRKIS